MTPATSVLLLTTLTGFGYGLLAWLGLFAAIGILPRSGFFLPVAVVIALAFSASGLAASMLHLGRPERAWRAFSQWRSSWLSREGIVSMATFPPALAFAVLWWSEGPMAPATRAVGLLAALLGLVTVGCTAMIYASLKPIRQWHNQHTAPDYLLFALFSGALLLAALVVGWTGSAAVIAAVALIGAVASAVAKFAYWRYIDRQPPLASLASATGLSTFGEVRPLDRPHFTENYILREMGFRIARKHAAKLRRITMVLAFAVPAVMMAGTISGIVPLVAACAGVVCAMVGLFIERWLFFAEATHVAALYYGR